MAQYFDDTQAWDNVEKFYQPTGAVEPLENETLGSSNHANVFNRRFQSVVNRLNWLKAKVSTGVLNQLILLTGNTNKILKFDASGNLVAVTEYEYIPPSDPAIVTQLKNIGTSGAVSKNIELNASGQLVAADFGNNPNPVASTSFSVGDIKETIVDVGASNPYIDENGYYWYIPDGTTLQLSKIWSELLFKKLWTSSRYSVTEGKGASAIADWNAGKNLVIPDMRSRVKSMVDSTRLLGTTYGNLEITLSQSHLRHRHNVSMAGVKPYGGNFILDDTSKLIMPAVFDLYPQVTYQNVAGNRAASYDSLGCILENSATSTPLNLEQRSIAVNYLIFTGYKT